MTQEPKNKKNIDYSASAVNLVNPPPVIADLKTLRDVQANIALLNSKISDCIPFELSDALKQSEKALAQAEQNLKADILAYGSYQNLETGEYALRQKRESITYKLDLVKKFAPPDVVYRVTVLSIDQAAFKEEISAGEVTPEQAKLCGEVKETYAFVIK